MSKETGKNLISLAIHGSTGRMGQEILKLATHEAGWDRVGCVARDGWGDVVAGDVDVVIDFSSPHGMGRAIDWCIAHEIPLVSGTTGLVAKDQEALERAGKMIPILWAANMSLGIHVLAHAMKSLGVLKDWDFQVEETHHRFKKDKPSGTGIFLQKELQSALGAKEIPEVLSLRVGGMVGDHSVTAASEEELLKFEHRAISRSVFARGALVAAQWLTKRKGKAQLYTMSDVLQS
jgi:4-hydroxy-tetrahydrodipicolinate reductase